MAQLMGQLAAIQGMRRDQIAARIRLRTLRALKASRPFSSSVRRRASTPSFIPARGLRLRSPLVGWPEEALASTRDQAQAVAEGRFCFLNAEREWKFPVDWQTAGASRLWRFHLHYFDDAPALALAASVSGEPEFAALFHRLASDWIDQNGVGVGDGWHPYTISRRIPNWVYALELSGRTHAPGSERILASLWDQARFLAGHLEYDALGNHLLANARALLFAGAYFGGEEARRWRTRAERILERELKEQFLADGGHFERSPMYHALVLQDLLECAALFRRRRSIPRWLGETMDRAEEWLRQMLHPDGRVALFNDCTLEGPSYPELAAFRGALSGSPSLRHQAGWRQLAWFGPAAPPAFAEHLEAPDRPETGVRQFHTLTALPESGYFVLRDAVAGHALFLDAGEPCPSYIPAHAHADLLSYELSLFGRRVIVDSGVCEYEAGPWRDYCRSTAAHNTVRVDGQDQSELWGSFRVGRRAHPLDVRWSASGHAAEVSASHTGYRRLRGEVMHRRTVTYAGSTYRVLDDVTGSGSHRVESFIHFHPEMQVNLEAGGLVARGQGVGVAIRFAAGVRAELHCGEEASDSALQGWYCPAFGVRQPSPVVVLVREGSLPAQISYEIQPLL